MEALERHEKIEGAAHGHHTGSSINRRIGLLISALAALLAISEAAGKSAQTEGITRNVEANDLWAFYQAKTIRMTTLRTAAETAQFDLLAPDLPEARRAAIQKQIDGWQATAKRYDSEPETNEGRKELVARAKEAEHRRDHAMHAYHLYEYGSAAFQIAIVLASATVITSFLPLAWIAGGLGLLGTAFSLLGWLTPGAVHF
ncbi:MAG TPA: DUF4337 domain-containing protein [Azospirillum sp.]